MLGREPEIEELNYWWEQIENGVSASQIAALFTQSEEAAGRFAELTTAVGHRHCARC